VRSVLTSHEESFSVSRLQLVYFAMIAVKHCETERLKVIEATFLIPPSIILSCRPPPHTGTTTHRITLTISTSRPCTPSSHTESTIHLSTTIPNRFDYMSAVSRGSSTSRKGRVSCRPPPTHSHHGTLSIRNRKSTSRPLSKPLLTSY